MQLNIPFHTTGQFIQKYLDIGADIEIRAGQI